VEKEPFSEARGISLPLLYYRLIRRFVAQEAVYFCKKTLAVAAA
jgi:hypothetical protein